MEAAACGRRRSEERRAERSRLNERVSERASNLSFVCVVAAPPPPGKERQTPTTATERREREREITEEGMMVGMPPWLRDGAMPGQNYTAERGGARQTDKPQKVIMRKYNGGRGD